jgi:hypothetical protein
METDNRLENLQEALLAAMEKEGSPTSSEWRQISGRLAEIETAAYDPSTGEELQRLVESLPAGAVDIEADLLQLFDSKGEVDQLVADGSPWGGGRQRVWGEGSGRPRIGRFLKTLAEMAERRQAAPGRSAWEGGAATDEGLVTERRRRINSALSSAWQGTRDKAPPVGTPKVLVLADDDDDAQTTPSDTSSGEPTPKGGQES